MDCICDSRVDKVNMGSDNVTGIRVECHKVVMRGGVVQGMRRSAARHLLRDSLAADAHVLRQALHGVALLALLQTASQGTVRQKKI